MARNKGKDEEKDVAGEVGENKCACGVPIRDDQTMCAVCKALHDRAKRKAKAKEKAKARKKNKPTEEALERLEEVWADVQATMAEDEEGMRLFLTRKLIGKLCESLPTKRVDVMIPDVKGKETPEKVFYTITK